MKEPRSQRPVLRVGDVFDIVAIDDSLVDLRSLESLVLQAFRPRARLRPFLDLDSALPSIAAFPPHLVIIDDRIGPATAVGTIAGLRSGGFAGPIAVVSGGGAVGRGDEVVAAGAIAYIAKDELSVARILELIDLAMDHSRLWRAGRTNPEID
jgi:DNA-binding NarL/FixJ family response regulator